LAKDQKRPASGHSVIDRYRAGDREGAFREVVEATRDSLYRFLLHMLRDEETARDVFQDTYVRVFAALGGFRGEASVTTWVLTVGRNTALNRIRTRKVAARGVSLEELGDAGLGAAGVADDAREPVATRSVLAAVESLPEAQREAVLLYYGEDRSVAEIASMTGRTANTVKSDLLRARRKLREILEPEGSDHGAP
jgi:RNA polymerase sigma-70 factor (ECF subfamily)